MKSKDIPLEQLDGFVLAERICSTLSLLGCLFIAVTFLGSKAFHKPVNRLSFFASIGNVLTSIATIVSRAAVHNSNGVLCQSQAFLIQMQVDSSSKRLLLTWLRFMPADAYWTFAMAVNVYLTFYWKYDAEALRSLEKWYCLACYGIPFVPALIYLFIDTPKRGHIYGNATLWCWISDDWDKLRIYSFYGPVWFVLVLTICIYARTGREIYMKREQLRKYSNASPRPSPVLCRPFQNTRTPEAFITSELVEAMHSYPADIEMNLTRQGNQKGLPAVPSKHRYAVSVSSKNPIPNSRRQYSFLYLTPASPRLPEIRESKIQPTRRNAAMKANSAALAYTKFAVLFFVAIMVTWIPSSANRVYSVRRPGEVVTGLEFASAMVLPLQGFWNALIYATTSLPACKQLWKQIWGQKPVITPGLNQNGVFAGREEPRKAIRRHPTESLKHLSSRTSTLASVPESPSSVTS